MTSRNDRKGDPVTARRKTPRTTAQIAAEAGALGAFIGGLLAWVWNGDWRWAVTGLGLALLALAVSTSNE